MSKIADYMQQRFDQTWSHPSWLNLLIVLPCTLGVVLAIHEWVVDRTVAQREKTTDGRITAHEPANHNRYGYSFSVSGESYSGWESPRKEEPHIGQQVTVFYDPADPTKNALTDFAELETDSLGPVPMLLFGIGSVALFIRYRRRRGRPAPQAAGENQ
jgi:Protein of unknown function (DUF3592)